MTASFAEFLVPSFCLTFRHFFDNPLTVMQVDKLEVGAAPAWAPLHLNYLFGLIYCIIYVLLFLNCSVVTLSQ